MLFRYNKKGGEKILSIWWFVVLAIAGGSIVIGVLMFYSADIDTRSLESAVLVERVSACIVNDGILNQGIVGGKFDFFAECGLDKEYFAQSGKTYFEVTITNSSGDILFGPFSGGARALKGDCLAAHDITAEKYPKCNSKTFGVVYNNDSGRVDATAEVFAASNQKGLEVFVANG